MKKITLTLAVVAMAAGSILPANAQRPSGGDQRKANVEAVIARMEKVIESGKLPEGVTAEQAAKGLAKLKAALAEGKRPAGGRPANVEPPKGKGDKKGGYPGGVMRVLATIDRIQTALDEDNLPEGVSEEQAMMRIAMLEQALLTGKRPPFERPDNVGGRPGGR